MHRERPARHTVKKVTLTINDKRDAKTSNDGNKNNTGEKPKKQAFTISHSQGRERGVPSRNSECDNDHRASDTLDHQTQTTSLAMTRRQIAALTTFTTTAAFGIPDVKERGR